MTHSGVQRQSPGRVPAARGRRGDARGRPFAARGRPPAGGVWTLALFCLWPGSAGCLGGRSDPSFRRSGPPAAPSTGEAVPELSQALAGKPYRDLRRHTQGTTGDVSWLDVSPDGGTLLYSSTQDGPTPNLYLKEEGSAGVIRKTSGRSSDIQPRFSPDGRWIAFASDRDGNFDIWIIPAEGAGGAEQATSSTDDEVHPAWSPEGRRIAISRRSPAHGWNLWILDRQDQSTVELGPGLFPDWSPTGEWIAFQKPSEREPHCLGLWIIHPDAGELRQVVAGDGFSARDPCWSPEGGLLAFTLVKGSAGDPSRPAGGEIWVVEIAHGKRYQITSGPGSDGSPVWGLSNRIYFTSERQGRRSIWSLIPPEVEG